MFWYFFASRTKNRWFDQTCVENVAFDLEYIFCFTLFFESRISYLLQYLKILLTLVDLIGSFKQIDFANTLLLMYLHKSILWFFSVLVLLWSSVDHLHVGISSLDNRVDRCVRNNILLKSFPLTVEIKSTEGYNIMRDCSKKLFPVAKDNAKQIMYSRSKKHNKYSWKTIFIKAVIFKTLKNPSLNVRRKLRLQVKICPSWI